MKILKSLLRISLALAAVAALSPASPAWAQVDLTRIAWIGDSEGAGFSAHCLTKRVQVDSPSAVIARTENVADFQQPIVNDPGLGGCLVLTSLAPSFTQEPSTGTPANLALPRPYNNLSIPGCAIHDMLVATTASQTSGSCALFIDLVLRNAALHLGSQVDQAIALTPTFVFLENVGNDYLGAVLTGTIIDGVTVTPLAPFTADYNTALTKLAAKQPKGIVFGVADVTSIPFTTTIPPFLTSGGKLVLNPATGAPIPLLGPKGCPTGVPACPIPATTLVTLNAASYLPFGYGIPCAVAPTLPKCNNPLPAAADPVTGNPGALIYASDVAFLKQRGADYNTAIKAAAAASGYKYYDVNDFLLRLKAGFDFGGITINAAFLTGGAFSYDGFHLTPIGYAILADDLIQFMNANFNAGLARVNLSTYLFNGGTNGGLSGSSAVYVPLNGEDYERAIQAIFTPEFARQLASMFSLSKPGLVQGGSGPVQRLEPHDRGPEQQ
jgi:hypothetical protein